jgi:hypothetical protein
MWIFAIGIDNCIFSCTMHTVHCTLHTDNCVVFPISEQTADDAQAPIASFTANQQPWLRVPARRNSLPSHIQKSPKSRLLAQYPIPQLYVTQLLRLYILQLPGLRGFRRPQRPQLHTTTQTLHSLADSQSRISPFPPTIQLFLQSRPSTSQ